MAKVPLPYRSEVVGSLLRPDYLKDAFERFDRGAIPESELIAVQDRAGLEAIELQQACGIDVITDGEVAASSGSTRSPRACRATTRRCRLPSPSRGAGTSRRDRPRCCRPSPR